MRHVTKHFQVVAAVWGSSQDETFERKWIHLSLRTLQKKKTYLRRRLLTFSPSLLTREFSRRISSSRTSFSCSSKGLELLSSAMAWVIFSSRRVISVWSFDSCFRAFLYSAFNSCLSLLGRFSPMAESEPRSVWDPMIVPTPVESSLTWKKVRSWYLGTTECADQHFSHWHKFSNEN